MEMMNIASGSSGNCTFFGDDRHAFLVDAGISMKRIEQGLRDIGRSLHDVNGIFITHEHSDHIKGLGAVSRKFSIPIYATKGTIREIRKTSSVGEIDENLFTAIDSVKQRECYSDDGFRVFCHSISHDAADPVCFRFEDGRSRAGIATDIGRFDDGLIQFLTDCDAMLIESNHDVRMLEVGPYSYSLKQRILGDRGHLSNENAGKLIRMLLNDHIKLIQLGHLSKENNFEELAYETVKSELIGNPFVKDIRYLNLSVAKPDNRSELITF